MAKSAGNFHTVRELIEKGHDPMAIRGALTSVHYRAPMNFTYAGLEEAQKNIDRVRDLVSRLEAVEEAPDRPEIAEAVDRAIREFDEGLDDDLNVSKARAALHGLVGDVNRIGTALSAADEARVRESLAAMDDVFGLKLLEVPEAGDLDAEIEALIERRNAARAAKDFARSDAIRDELAAKGILLVDTPEGTTWKRA
jgi:cysteinyl-tRNA synthetase